MDAYKVTDGTAVHLVIIDETELRQLQSFRAHRAAPDLIPVEPKRMSRADKIGAIEAVRIEIKRKRFEPDVKILLAELALDLMDEVIGSEF